MADTPKPIAFGHYVITATAGDLFSFAQAGSPTSIPEGARSFKGRLEADIRSRMQDGTNPSATVGELISEQDDMVLDENMMRVFNFVRRTGDAALQGHFYHVPGSYWK